MTPWCAKVCGAPLAILSLLAACGGGDNSENTDPLASMQWHLTGTHEGQATVHIDALGLDVSGHGVTVALIDDGLDIDHPDLRDGVLDFNISYLPRGLAFDDAPHGTAAAGLIAARQGNGLGGRGVAPGANLVAYSVLRAPAMANFADALLRDAHRVDVYNNSWGDFSGWGVPLPLHPYIEAALRAGTRSGRGGKGAVYVFSAGNGAQAGWGGLPADNVNWSGLVNNPWTVVVCAVDHQGRHAPYSERGATLTVCAPSSGAGLGTATSAGIVTTDVSGDRGYNDGRPGGRDLADNHSTQRFGGTSAAAPMVAGVVALVLEANPNLGWRDVKAILASSALRTDEAHADWSRNGAGLWVNHTYGFGLVQARAAVALAREWTNLPEPALITLSSERRVDISDNGNVASDSLHINSDELVEFVEIEVDIPSHPRLSDLEIVLVAPSGTRSVLAELHHQQFEEFRLRQWRFGSARHLGERSAGEWRLELRDRRPGQVGTLLGWKLRLHVAPGRGRLAAD